MASAKPLASFPLWLLASSLVSWLVGVGLRFWPPSWRQSSGRSNRRRPQTSLRFGTEPRPKFWLSLPLLLLLPLTPILGQASQPSSSPLLAVSPNLSLTMPSQKQDASPKLTLTEEELRGLIQMAVNKAVSEAVAKAVPEAVRLAVADERSKRIVAEVDRDYWKSKDADDERGKLAWGGGGLLIGAGVIAVLELFIKR